MIDIEKTNQCVEILKPLLEKGVTYMLCVADEKDADTSIGVPSDRIAAAQDMAIAGLYDMERAILRRELDKHDVNKLILRVRYLLKRMVTHPDENRTHLEVDL